MGGEKLGVAVKQVFGPGSPPRGRGKDVPFVGTLAIPGITPAWAGKSEIADLHAKDEEDHPRVGGEKPDSFRMAIFDKGSPPRGRGKGQNIGPHTARKGITPAWAGKR